MNVLTVLTLAVAPGLFWLWFFYKRDKLEPEPKTLIAKTFLLGVGVAFPVVIVQALFVVLPLPAFLLYTVIAPITEEYGKYAVVRHGVFNHAEFDEPIDGIIYGVAAALGFATIENVGYLLGSYLTPEETLGAGASVSSAVLFLFVVRSLLSVPGHAIWASLWGYALGVAKFSAPASRSNKLIRNGLALAMFSHGLFNGLLLLHPLLAVGVLAVIPIGWRMAFRRIGDALAASPHAVRSLDEQSKL